MSASVLEGADIVYIARTHIRRIMNISIAPGARLPACATSMGWVHLACFDPSEVVRRLHFPLPRLTRHTVTAQDELLARLDAVRSQGWSLVEHELEVGLRSMAVPVFGPEGVVAAINVALGVTTGLGASAAELEARFVGPLRSVAERIGPALRQRR